MSSAAIMGLHPPLIYCINANILTHAAQWRPLLARVAAMHFNIVLLNGDHLVALHAQADAPAQRAAFKDFSAACAQAGLRLFLDLELDRFAYDHPLPVQQDRKSTRLNSSH